MKKYDVVLFDLDGTLCETGEGIRNSIRYALAAMKKPVPDEETLRRFIGPPLRDSFRQFCRMTEAEISEGVRLFRARYDSVGWMETKLYPGVRDLLQKLSNSDARVATATSKPEHAAKRIIAHFGIDRYFDEIVGSLPESRTTKKELIPYSVSLCGGKEGDSVLMVGDTSFDARGARETGVDFVGVLWGYGSQAEMQREGAKYFVKDARELEVFLELNNEMEIDMIY